MPQPMSAFGMQRRNMLKFIGVSAAAIAIGVSCNKDDTPSGVVNLGSGDVGILNYAYALEQLEAAFLYKGDSISLFRHDLTGNRIPYGHPQS